MSSDDRAAISGMVLGGMLGLLVGLLVGTCVGLSCGTDDGFRSGQIDYANGKVHVRLESQPNGETKWVYSEQPISTEKK